MFRCQVCQLTSNPGEKVRRFAVYRNKNKTVFQSRLIEGGHTKSYPVEEVGVELAREVLCCSNCHAQLVAGIPLALVERREREDNRRAVETCVDDSHVEPKPRPSGNGRGKALLTAFGGAIPVKLAGSALKKSK